MGVLAGDFDVQGRTQAFCKRAEEVFDHLGGKLANLVARKGGVEHEGATPRQVQRYLGLAFVHRQQETVTADAEFVAERLA